MSGEQFDYTNAGGGSVPNPPGRHGWQSSPWQAAPPVPPRRNRTAPVALIGCGAVLVFFLAVLSFIGGIGYLVMTSIKSSDIYATALEKARTHSPLQERLGEPIQAGWYVMGSYSTNNSEETASLTVPLTGPFGGATLYVEGRKRAGLIAYSELAVVLDDSGERIEIPKD
ncbi:MAG: hypothetical protein KIT83_00605 [Bryobacterales bacterium]|nr:hypothetical protein [Bryobacterales bacterium]